MRVFKKNMLVRYLERTGAVLHHNEIYRVTEVGNCMDMRTPGCEGRDCDGTWIMVKRIRYTHNTTPSGPEGISFCGWCFSPVPGDNHGKEDDA